MIKAGQVVLLGILCRGPHSGYDIKKATKESTEHFWSESYGQIYPNLKKLKTAGLVTSQKERQEGKPDREVYTITKAGRGALQTWLESPPSFGPPRNELLLKLFFGQHSSPKPLTEHVEAYKGSYLQDLETYKGIERWLETEFADHPALPYWLMTLSHGRTEAQALLTWCDETLVTLKALGKKQTKEES